MLINTLLKKKKKLQDVYNHIHKIIEILEHYKLTTYTLEQLNDVSYFFKYLKNYIYNYIIYI